ncbi:MAG: YdbH domain-containing protein, partial [Deltaproteobacteria bacterium]|nr:YdbH domain-containing protein [Deltaproteobacteria bacterium]
MRYKPIKFFLFLLVSLLAGGILTNSILLPRYLEKNVLPSLGAKLSTSLSGKVNTLGLNKTSVDNLILGQDGNIALSIASIEADYTLTAILDKKIKRVGINGLRLNLGITEGKLVVPGINLDKIFGEKIPSGAPQPSSEIHLPVLVDSFQLSNGLISFWFENQRVFIPFDLQLNKIEGEDKNNLPVYRLGLRLFPYGEEIVFTGIIDLANNKTTINFSAGSLNLNYYAFLFGDEWKKINPGKAVINGRADMKLKPFELVAAEIDCRLESLSFKEAPVVFGQYQANTETAEPIRLLVRGKGQEWDVISHGSITKPIPAAVVLQSSLQVQNAGNMNGNGTFSVKSLDGSLNFSYADMVATVRENPELQGSFSFVLQQSGTWKADIEGAAPQKNFEILYAGKKLSAKYPSFTITGKGSGDGDQIDVLFAITDVHASDPDKTSIFLPSIELQGEFRQDGDATRKNHRNGDFIITIPEIEFKKETVAVSAAVSLAGKMFQSLRNRESLQLEGELSVNKAKGEEQGSGISFDSFTGTLPWQWPHAEEEKRGRLEITGIRWRDNELGSFEAEIQLRKSSYELEGGFNHTLPGGLLTKITGHAGIADPGLRARIAVYMATAPFATLHLGDFASSMSGSFLSGDLGLDGELELAVNSLNGYMNILLQNGRFEFPEKNLNIENIHLKFALPSLPDLRSAPAQKVNFDRITMGDLSLNKGKVVWRLESPDSIFIEEGAVDWVGGRMFANAVRISPNINEYIVTIFCDRLILSEILTQFGISGAEGEGTVSGRIPLHISKGSIRFEDGFLYSSPGKGGSVKVAAFELLSAGIPKNTPQFAQVDFAAEA